MAHGCLAGLHEKAFEVYCNRILRGTGRDGFYSSRKLGAIGANLCAVACFFDPPWTRLSPNLSPAAHAWLLSEAAYHRRAQGRLTLENLHVTSTYPEGPAYRAGIRPGDVITHIDGQRIVDGRSTMKKVAQLKPGDAVEVTLQRGENSLSVPVIVGTRPARNAG